MIFFDETYSRMVQGPSDFFSVLELIGISWHILRDFFKVFPQISSYGLSCEEFAKICSKERYIAIFQSIYLDKNSESFIRPAYTQNIDILFKVCLDYPKSAI